MSQQYGLGRGLASLIPPKKNTSEDSQAEPVRRFEYEEAEERPAAKPAATQGEGDPVPPDASVREVPIIAIVPNPEQPRLHFDEEKLAELSESIREHGILQPLVVTEAGSHFELIAGERRFQAAKKAGLTTVPVVVRSVSDREKLELAIIENIQRHNLNPIEEAKAYQRLVHEFGMSQEEVAKKMGKSRPSIANTLRLLYLPVEIQRAVASGRISEGHAKALLAIENPEKQRAVFELIIKEELTVRETENRVRSVAVKSHVRTQKPKDQHVLEAVSRLSERLGTKVDIKPAGKGGRVIIEYYSEEELNGLLERFS